MIEAAAASVGVEVLKSRVMTWERPCTAGERFLVRVETRRVAMYSMWEGSGPVDSARAVSDVIEISVLEPALESGRKSGRRASAERLM